ncbi:PREDICTED: probable maltase-glucoamylase-like protein [Propithecus coquereli]|uniref:probable maltase-glucoamylase-like protein n=1 Tax=Propithecus coquereli TaxID=379532 RepID=UPI00063FC6D0|nr:PREDICTED: probable maltase-glucoamylase-like protein [Propithecus coquereli]
MGPPTCRMEDSKSQLGGSDEAPGDIVTATATLITHRAFSHLADLPNLALGSSSGYDAVFVSFSIFIKNRLQAKITNNNYTDPDNLMFSYIRILGMDKQPANFTVLVNNAATSNPSVAYSISTKVVTITDLQGLVLGQEFSIEWNLPVSDLEKFNCYPEDPTASEESCGQRGCLWELTTTPGVPTCYYDTIPDYVASNIQYLSTGITADLALLGAPESASST